MSYSRKVPQNRIEPLAWLGKTDWITPTAKGYRWSRDLQRILDGSLQLGNNFAEEVRQIINLATFDATPSGPRPSSRTIYSDMFFMSSKVLATGQKTIRLSQEWCEAFENTEVTLAFRDYRQPFDTMVVELPANYSENKFVPGATDYPEYIAIHHQPDEQMLLIEVVFHRSQAPVLIPYRLDDPVESVMNGFQVRQVDHLGDDFTGTESYFMPFFRIALNAVVAMTYGTEWQKVEPARNERKTKQLLKKSASGKDKVSARKARLRIGTLPEVFQFDQTIKAFDEHGSATDAPPSQTGTPKKPHWRRGHWRHQAVGQGRTQRELKWIRPMLINSDRFKGDLKDTTTTYTA